MRIIIVFTSHLSFISAERRGFEPRIRFWRIHAFQACLFNHSSITPSGRSRKNSGKYNTFFGFDESFLQK